MMWIATTPITSLVLNISPAAAFHPLIHPLTTVPPAELVSPHAPGWPRGQEATGIGDMQVALFFKVCRRVLHRLLGNAVEVAVCNR